MDCKSSRWTLNVIKFIVYTFGDKVFIFNTEKFSLCFNQSFKVGLLKFFFSVSCSIKVNLCMLDINLCHSFLKWAQAGMAFGLLTSFLWLFNLMLKLVSDLPTYWRLHRIHSSKQIIHWLSHVMLWYILKTLFVRLILKVLVFTTCIPLAFTVPFFWFVYLIHSLLNDHLWGFIYFYFV